MLLMENEFDEFDCLACLAAEDHSFLEIEGVSERLNSMTNLIWSIFNLFNFSPAFSDAYSVAAPALLMSPVFAVAATGMYYLNEFLNDIFLFYLL